MTITYLELHRKINKQGFTDVVAQFTDTETGKTIVTALNLGFDPPETKVLSRLAAKASRIEFSVNPLNYMEMEGLDLRDILKQVVLYIRAHPECTFNDLVTAADTAYPDLPWKADKLLLRIHEYLQDMLKLEFTFAQFKTYAINHKFSQVDG